jgi:ADP-heptose:LPS heptosyltransferase
MWHEQPMQFLEMENCSMIEHAPRCDPVRRILVICTDRIGDTFNCIYFLANLRRLYPAASIFFLGRSFNDPDFLPILVGPLVDRTLATEKSSGPYDSRPLDPDVIFDLNPRRFFAVIRPPRTVCFGHHEHCDIVVPFRDHNFKANEHLNILRAMGKSVRLEYPAITLAPVASITARRRPYVVLSLEATAVTWTLSHVTADSLVEYLRLTTAHDIYIVGSNINQHAYQHPGDNERVFNLTSQLSLCDALRLISGAAFVVSVDTGLMHAASYLGVPLLTAFTCGDPSRNGPQGQIGRVALVRVTVDPPTHCREKADYIQSGIERHYLRLDHLVDGLNLLEATEPTRVEERIIGATPAAID